MFEIVPHLGKALSSFWESTEGTSANEVLLRRENRIMNIKKRRCQANGLPNPLGRRPAQESLLKKIRRESRIIGNSFYCHFSFMSAPKILHHRLGNGGKILDCPDLAGFINLVKRSPEIIVFHLERQTGCFVNPKFSNAEFHFAGTLGCAFHHKGGILA